MKKTTLYQRSRPYPSINACLSTLEYRSTNKPVISRFLRVFQISPYPKALDIQKLMGYQPAKLSSSRKEMSPKIPVNLIKDSIQSTYDLSLDQETEDAVKLLPTPAGPDNNLTCGRFLWETRNQLNLIGGTQPVVVSNHSHDFRRMIDAANMWKIGKTSRLRVEKNMCTFRWKISETTLESDHESFPLPIDLELLSSCCKNCHIVL